MVLAGGQFTTTSHIRKSGCREVMGGGVCPGVQSHLGVGGPFLSVHVYAYGHP